MKRPFLENFFGTVDKMFLPQRGRMSPATGEGDACQMFLSVCSIPALTLITPVCRRAMLGAGGSTMAGQRPPLRWARSSDRAHRRGRVRGRLLPSSGSREIAGCHLPQRGRHCRGARASVTASKREKQYPGRGCCFSYYLAVVPIAYSAVLFLSSVSSCSRSCFTRVSIRWASSAVAFPA